MCSICSNCGSKRISFFVSALPLEYRVFLGDFYCVDCGESAHYIGVEEINQHLKPKQKVYIL